MRLLCKSRALANPGHLHSLFNPPIDLQFETNLIAQLTGLQNLTQPLHKQAISPPHPLRLIATCIMYTTDTTSSRHNTTCIKQVSPFQNLAHAHKDTQRVLLKTLRTFGTQLHSSSRQPQMRPIAWTGCPFAGRARSAKGEPPRLRLRRLLPGAIGGS